MTHNMTPKQPQTPETIEFDWNEVTGLATYTKEDQRTGAITFVSRLQPLAKPVVTEATLLDYFTNLSFWLRTQPQEWGAYR